MESPNLINKTSVAIAVLALGGICTALAIPKAVDNLKPIGTRMTEQFDVLTDKKTGEIYGWITGKDNEQRFVRMDKLSEAAVRKEREKAAYKRASGIKKPYSDVTIILSMASSFYDLY